MPFTTNRQLQSIAVSHGKNHESNNKCILAQSLKIYNSHIDFCAVAQG